MGTEITRRLATVRKIAEIHPIEGADRIVRAVVDGWSVVTQKSNNFAPGDLVVYFEIDSFLPIHPAFDWLYDGCYKNVEGLGPGYRLRTIKLKKTLSQGLILPFSAVSEDNVKDGLFYKFTFGNVEPIYAIAPIISTLLVNGHYVEPVGSVGDNARPLFRVREGDDLTEMLNVVKYEPPIPASLAGIVRSTFPSYIPKADQERLQNVMNYFKGDWFNYHYEVTMKVDGSSCTIFHKDGDVGVCSRNMDLRETEGNAYWQVARKYNLVEKLKELNLNIAIQGELMGPGVQGNRENLKELDMFVFDIFDIDHGKYLGAEERKYLVDTLGLRHVPVLKDFYAPDIANPDEFTIEFFLDMANIGSINHLVAEGIVFKAIEDPSISFKVINNRFLLDEGN